MRRRFDDEIEADPVVSLICTFAAIGVLSIAIVFAYGIARTVWPRTSGVTGARAFSGCVCVDAQEESR